MIEPKDKAEIETVIKISFLLAAIDLTLATTCAIYGSNLFVPFMILAGLMWLYGTCLKAKADKIGE